MVVFAVLLISAVVSAFCPPGAHPRHRFVRVVLVSLFLFCWTPLSMLIVFGMQGPRAPEPSVVGEAEAIVVLAGAVHAPAPPLGEPLVDADTYERCRYAARLSRESPRSPVVVSGGSPDGLEWKYADAMRDVLLREGVPASRMILEDRSRTTAENARFTTALLKQRAIGKVVLVTDALHMRRARLTFEKLGVNVKPAPCAFRPVYRVGWADLLPSWRAIQWNDAVLHEVVGLLWYRARGWI